MTIIRAVSQVFRIEFDPVLLEKLTDLLDEVFIQRGRAANRQRQAMADKIVFLGEFPELFTKGTTNANPVFRCNFHEADLRRGRLQQLFDAVSAQAKAGAVYFIIFMFHINHCNCRTVC